MKADQIIQAVCDAYGDTYTESITPEMVTGQTRLREAATCRQISAYILRVYCGLSYSRIGRIVGRNHSTIIHATNTVDGWRDRKMLECKVLSGALSRLGNPHRIGVDIEPVKQSSNISNERYNEYRKMVRAVRRARAAESKAIADANNARADADTLRGEVARLNAVIAYALANPKRVKGSRSMRPHDEVVKPMEWTPEQRKTLAELRQSNRV